MGRALTCTAGTTPPIRRKSGQPPKNSTCSAARRLRLVASGQHVVAPRVPLIARLEQYTTRASQDWTERRQDVPRWPAG